MLRLKIIVGLFLLLGYAQINSQSQLDWLKQSRSDLSFERIDDIELMPDDGVIMCGAYHDGEMMFCDSIFKNPNGYNKSFIVRLNREGELMWKKEVYGRVYNVESDGMGNIYIAGDCDERLFRIDNDTVFQRMVIRGESSETFLAKFSEDGLLMKTLVLDNIRANSTFYLHYDTVTQSLLTSIQISDSDSLRIGNLKVALRYLRHSNTIVKLNLDLEPLKACPIESNEGTYNVDIKTDGEGKVYVVGAYSGDGLWYSHKKIDSIIRPEGRSGFVIKIDHNLGLDWSKILHDGVSFVHNNEVEINSNNKIILVGSFRGNLLICEDDTLLYKSQKVEDYNEFFQIMITDNGGIEWVRTFDLGYAPRGSYTCVNQENHIFSSWPFSKDTILIDDQILFNNENIRHDVLLTIQNEGGEILWTYTYGGRCDEIPMENVFTSSGDIIFSGGFESAGIVVFNKILERQPTCFSGEDNLFIAKLISPLINSSNTHKNTGILTVYPTVSEGMFTISNLPRNTKVMIFGQDGKRISFTRNGELFSLEEGVNSGVYFLLAITKDDHVSTSKLILIK